MNARYITPLLAGGALLCLLAIGVLFATGAQAQGTPKCGPRADLVKMLDQKYHEVPISIGMINETMVMETFASVAGTWTMFITNTDNVSCMVADGDNWAFDTSAFDAAKKGEAM